MLVLRLVSGVILFGISGAFENGLVQPCARHDSNARPLPPGDKCNGYAMSAWRSAVATAWDLVVAPSLRMTV